MVKSLLQKNTNFKISGKLVDSISKMFETSNRDKMLHGDLKNGHLCTRIFNFFITGRRMSIQMHTQQFRQIGWKSLHSSLVSSEIMTTPYFLNNNGMQINKG